MLQMNVLNQKISEFIKGSGCSLNIKQTAVAYGQEPAATHPGLTGLGQVWERIMMEQGKYPRVYFH
jgi:hypothetical protein